MNKVTNTPMFSTYTSKWYTGSHILCLSQLKTLQTTVINNICFTLLTHTRPTTTHTMLTKK